MNVVAFSVLGFLMVLSALGVVLNRNPVRSAMCLVGTLVLLAVTFVFLEAHLVAALQIVVYTGAIMVLFLFVIMLLNLQQEPFEPGRAGARGFAMVASVVFAGLVIVALMRTGPPSETSGIALPTEAGFGTSVEVGKLLFSSFVLPFEITSILLLVAIVGAVVVAKKRLQ